MTESHSNEKTRKPPTNAASTCMWIVVSLLSSLFTLPASASPRTTAGSSSSIKPNVITIITDDQGWADIGYNNPKVYTPNLDALAAESALCTRH